MVVGGGNYPKIILLELGELNQTYYDSPSFIIWMAYVHKKKRLNWNVTCTVLHCNQDNFPDSFEIFSQKDQICAKRTRKRFFQGRYVSMSNHESAMVSYHIFTMTGDGL
jgi:hypothetical protein